MVHIDRWFSSDCSSAATKRARVLYSTPKEEGTFVLFCMLIARARPRRSLNSLCAFLLLSQLDAFCKRHICRPTCGLGYSWGRIETKARFRLQTVGLDVYDLWGELGASLSGVEAHKWRYRTIVIDSLHKPTYEAQVRHQKQFVGLSICLDSKNLHPWWKASFHSLAYACISIGCTSSCSLTYAFAAHFLF